MDLKELSIQVALGVIPITIYDLYTGKNSIKHCGHCGISTPFTVEEIKKVQPPYAYMAKYCTFWRIKIKCTRCGKYYVYVNSVIEDLERNVKRRGI